MQNKVKPVYFAAIATNGRNLISKFFCPFCREYHVHGAGAGTRVAHCKNKELNPALVDNEYIIIPFDPEDGFTREQYLKFYKVDKREDRWVDNRLVSHEVEDEQ